MVLPGRSSATAAVVCAGCVAVGAVVGVLVERRCAPSRKRRAPERQHRQASSQANSVKSPKLAMDNRVESKLTEPIVHQLREHVEHSSGPLIVGVAGGTGSGKTTLSRAVHEAVGVENVTYICHDSYYRDLSHLPMADRVKNNFDHPDALETSLLEHHIAELRAGRGVDVPVYDFSVHTRTGRTVRAEPNKVILVEGILIFGHRGLREKLDIKIFVDTEADVRFIRRLRRDMDERGRTADDVMWQYLQTVKPMHEQFVEPSKRLSDIIVPVGLNQVALELVVSRLRFSIAAA